MPTDISTTLAGSLRTQYIEDYIEGGVRRRMYDQVASPIDELAGAATQADSLATLSQSGTVQLVFLSDMRVGTVPISEVIDVVPQTLRDATTTVLTNMYGEAVQTSQKALLMRYTDYGAAVAKKVGLNMMESVDNRALEAALQGGLVHRAAVRTSLDAGTAAHRATNDIFSWVAARFQSFNCPGWEDGGMVSYVALTNPFVVHDIATSGDIVNVAQYQQAQIILNHELGILNNFRIVSSGLAKIFYGAGVINASDVQTTLSLAANALATTITVASATNIEVGDWLNILPLRETANVFEHHNERVKVTSVAGAVIGVAGEGQSGGLRFDHPALEVVTANDAAHTILFAGPSSLAKVYAPSVGEFGELVMDETGLLKQWVSAGWKWYGGYGRPVEPWLYRAEVSVEEEA